MNNEQIFPILRDSNANLNQVANFCLLMRFLQCIGFFEVIKLFSGTNVITYKPDHLRIATTCQQQPPFLGPIFNFYNTKLPLNNNHLSTTAPFLGSKGGQ